jgi:hypothetical protein
MIVVLTVMSGMDPHTIIETLYGFGLLVGRQTILWFRSNYCNGLCGRFDVAFQGEELVA